MPDAGRVAELRRRLESDPSSLAFAALAEELRRQGQLDEAIALCRTGLEIHPSFLSGHMTLGRALYQSGDQAGAQASFETVLAVAPDNLLASRSLAEIYENYSRLAEARACLENALRFAGKDSAIEARLAALDQRIGLALAPEPPKPEEPAINPPPQAGWGAQSVDAPTANFDSPPTFILPDFESLAEPPVVQAEEFTSRVPLSVADDPAFFASEPSRVEDRASLESSSQDLFADLSAIELEGPPPTEILATSTLGELYLEQGAPEEAAHVFRNVLDREPGNSRARTGLESAVSAEPLVGPALIQAQIVRLERFLHVAQSSGRP